MPSFGTD